MTKRISELPAVTMPLVTDQFEVNQGGTSKRATLEQIRNTDWRNVKDYGAVGIGAGHDDTSAFLAAIAACPDNGQIYVPSAPRFYHITETLDCGDKCVHWVGNRGNGDEASGTTSMGSMIVGTIATPLLKFSGPGRHPGPNIHGLSLLQHGTGDGLYLKGWTTPSINHCTVNLTQDVGTAINMPENVFTAYVEQCAVIGGAVGILAPSHTQIMNCDVTGCTIGIHAQGTCSNVIGCRLEVNETGIKCDSLQRSLIAGNSFEANDIGIHVVYAVGCQFSAMGMEGSVNAPSGASIYGLYMEYAEAVCFDAIHCGGTYTNTAIYLTDGATVGGRTSWRACRGESAQVASWRIPVGYAPTHGDFIQCNNP